MRTPGRLFILAVLAAATGLACSAVAADADGRASAPRQTLIHDGIERSYVLRVPAGAAGGNARVALVVVLHGGGGNADNAEQMTGFTDKSRSEGFIVVYPEGSGRRKDRLLTWNAGHCCGYAMERRIDDVGFIGALVDRLIAAYPIDPARVYATGMSNGAMMAHRLGIERSGKFAAIAPVVGTLFGDEKKPPHPVSALMINGLLDKSVPDRGGPPGGRFTGAWDGTPTRPALDQAAFWAEVDGCSGVPAKDAPAAFTRWQYQCPANRAVELYLVNDNGHAWPGGHRGSWMGDRPASSPDATDVIWNFFKAHPK